MKPKAVPEYSAKGETERVYHEIRQCLSVPGVNLNFRTWASYEKFFPVMWDEMRPNVLSAEFENGADRIRDDAVSALRELSFPNENPVGAYGESRQYQIRAALDLYHDVNPKLLVFTSAVRLALLGHKAGVRDGSAPRAPEGEPEKMFAMEMEVEKPKDPSLRAIFRDIKKTLGLSQINSDYRTLGLWPDYLESAWKRLKPVCQSTEFARACERLRLGAREIAARLPYTCVLDLDSVKALGENAQNVLKTTEQFEQLLPGLILNIAMLRSERDARSGRASIPAARARTRSEPEWRAFQRRQKVVELGSRFISYIDEGEGDPVVLLHGIPTWSFLWNDTIAALRKRYRVIAPDLLGFGYSEKRDCFDRSIARQDEMIAAFLDALEIHSAHIVAHDIGGGVALRLAALEAPRVRSLCLMNSVCYDSWPIELMLQLGHPSARRQLSATGLLKLLKQAVKMGCYSTPDPSIVEGLLSPWRTEVGKLSLIRNASGLNTSLTTEITPLLPRISVPVLVLWGEDDRFQLIKYGERLVRDIAGAELHRIAEARHFVMLDQPGEVNTRIRKFLDTQSKGPGRRRTISVAPDLGRVREST